MEIVRLLHSINQLEFIFLFHGNGYLREHALQKIAGTEDSAFIFAAISYRLNDWVVSVRRAAFDCVLRVFPDTDPGIVADAAMTLLNQRRLWQRGQEEALILDETFSRADVARALIGKLTVAQTGSPARVLVAALADSRLDAYLRGLTQMARQPAVRAVALRTMLECEAVWPEGLEKKWIDKSMGRYRLAPRVKRRVVSHDCSPEVLISEGVADPAIIVRKVAMQAIVNEPDLWNERKGLIERLATDRSAAIRAGIAYIRRQQLERG